MSEALQTALAQFGLPESSAERLEEFSDSSQIYRCPAGILKLFHRPDKFWRERGTLTLLEGTGFVPIVIRSKEPMSDFPGALLMEEVPGQNLDSIPLDEKLTRSAGKRLGQLHGFTFGGLGYPGPHGQLFKLPFKGWWSYRRALLVNEWGTVIRSRLPEEFVDACLQKLEALSQGFSDDEKLCATHGEFSFSNLILSPEQKLYLLDFETTQQGDPSYDFIKVWERLREKHELWAAFLAGYRSIRPVPSDLGYKLQYYWFDLNYGLLFGSIERGDEAMFRQRLRTVEELLTL